MASAAGNAPPELWVHAVAAKAGGGVTYLRAVVPELVAQLEGRGVRLVLLVPEPLEGFVPPSWMRIVPLRRWSNSALARIVFDLVALPLWLGRRRAALFCSGNFAPVAKPVPTVALVRNAIYFEPEFLGREWWGRRLLLRLQGLLIRLGARGCVAVHYPSRYMQSIFEAASGGARLRGRVNYYGIGGPFLQETRQPPARSNGGGPWRFLLVMNYTLQKNLTFVLKALAKAKAEGLPVRVTVTSSLENGPRASRSEDRRLRETRRLVESGHLELVGPRYGRELIELYKASDACLVPSICESFAHPLVEAMALHKPLVCADRPYAREICGDRALYVDPHRPEDLVALWWDWPQPLARVREHGRDELLATYSWSAHVSRLLEDLCTEDR